MTAIVIQGDARQLPLPDESVDLIVTSPPYWSLRSYTDGGQHYDGQIGAEATPADYVAALLECTREWMRVLKQEGSIFVVLGDKYNSAQSNQNLTGATARPAGGQKAYNPGWRGRVADNFPVKSLLCLPERYRIGCVDQLGLVARARIVWHKPNPMPESVTDRVAVAHEDIVHLTKQQTYYADLDAVREPHSAPRRRAGANAFRARNASHLRTATGDYAGPNARGALPGSVWTIASQGLDVPEQVAHARCCGDLVRPECSDGLTHYAAFPTALVRRIVLGWSPLGGLVADPFGGTGTAALVASAHGRRAISIDRSADYCRLARWRTTDPRERARALGVTPPPPVSPEQGDLFSTEEIA